MRGQRRAASSINGLPRTSPISEFSHTSHTTVSGGYRALSNRELCHWKTALPTLLSGLPVPKSKTTPSVGSSILISKPSSLALLIEIRFTYKFRARSAMTCRNSPRELALQPSMLAWTSSFPLNLSKLLNRWGLAAWGVSGSRVIGSGMSGVGGPLGLGGSDRRCTPRLSWEVERELRGDSSGTTPCSHMLCASSISAACKLLSSESGV